MIRPDPTNTRYLSAIQADEGTIEYEKQQWLEARGWDYTANFVDPWWRWHKTFPDDGRDKINHITTANINEALRVEVYMESMGHCPSSKSGGHLLNSAGPDDEELLECKYCRYRERTGCDG